MIANTIGILSLRIPINYRNIPLKAIFTYIEPRTVYF